MSRCKLLPLVALFFCTLATASHANFIGNTVRATASFPVLNTPSTTAGPVDSIVGAGVEFSDGQFTPFFGPTFDFASDTILITHAATGHASGSFNGYTFFDLNSTIPDITNVSITSDSTGFFLGDPSRVFFDTENVFVNFESLSFAGQNLPPEILLTVSFGAQQVPEPATLALFGLGLAGLGIAARRRKMHASR